MALNLAKVIVEFLKSRPEERFTSASLAQWVFVTFPEECNSKKQKSQSIHTDQELIQQLQAEIGAYRSRIQKQCPEIQTTEGRPRHYYYSPLPDTTEAAKPKNKKSADKASADDDKEYLLYPLLAEYLKDAFGVYAQRIDEKKSSNKQGPKANQWLHPDLVGMEDIGADWHPEIQACVSHYADKRTRLWSFEVKRKLERSNVRESFFQTVSNSSWANLGYLVAGEITGDGSVLKELRLLSAAHGIGLILLNEEDPTDSEVIIPAREKPVVEWGIANRLATENKDFLAYVKRVKRFYQTGEAHHAEWAFNNPD